MLLKQNISLSSVLPKYLFWEYDISKLTFRENYDIIIPRALYMTDEKSFDKDILIIEKIYPKEIIAEVLQRTTENISDTVCRLVSKRYHTVIKSKFAV